MIRSDSCSFTASITDYLSGRMPDAVACEFEAHLNECPVCLAALAHRTPAPEDDNWLQILRNPFAATQPGGSADSGAGSAATLSIVPAQQTAPQNQALSPANPVVPPADLSLRYTWIRPIGSGGAGEVWEAWDQMLQRTVAIKLLRNASPTLHESQRLLQEASALARFSHPHIVSLHEVENSGGRPALIMEFVAGPSLAAWLRGQPTTPAAAAQLLEQLCQALEHAHAHGVVHRDLKPSNILLKPVSSIPPTTDHSRPDLSCWAPKIADFGLARLTDQPHLTLSGQQLGTPSYMAPEQVAPAGDNIAANPLIDIYGLGAVLYELLTGRPPFVSSDPALTMAMILRENPISPRSLTPAIPRDLETICLKCLRKEPRQRYQSATELRNDLLAFLDNRPIAARPVSAATRLLNWCRRHPAESTAAAASSALLLALAGGAVWYAALQKQLGLDALQTARLASEKQQLQEQQQKTVREKFDELLRAHYYFVQMLDDPNAAPGGDLRKIREHSLQNGGRLAVQYLEMLDQSLQAGRQPSTDELSLGIDSLAMAIRSNVVEQPETRIQKLRELVADIPANALPTPARIELDVRLHHLQAGALSRNRQHTLAGHAYCSMADLLERQSLQTAPADPYRIERLSKKISMLLNARFEFLTDNRQDLALPAVQRAEQTCQLLIEEDPQNLNWRRLLLECKFLKAQLLPPEEGSRLAKECMEIASQTEWPPGENLDRIRSLQQVLQPLLQ